MPDWGENEKSMMVEEIVEGRSGIGVEIWEKELEI